MSGGWLYDGTVPSGFGVILLAVFVIDRRKQLDLNVKAPKAAPVKQADLLQVMPKFQRKLYYGAVPEWRFLLLYHCIIEYFKD